MKAYIISFYQREISDDELVAFLQTKKDVLNLLRALPNIVFVVSDRNAASLSSLIEKKFPDSFFIVAEYVPYNSDGALLREMWNFLNEPKRARKANKSASNKKRLTKAKSTSRRK